MLRDKGFQESKDSVAFREQSAARLWMNAGAYGHEIGTVTETVRVAREGVGRRNSRQRVFSGTIVTLHFKEGELLLGATLRLKPDDPRQQSRRAWTTRRAGDSQPNHTARVPPDVFSRTRRRA